VRSDKKLPAVGVEDIKDCILRWHLLGMVQQEEVFVRVTQAMWQDLQGTSLMKDYYFECSFLFVQTSRRDR
jgi:hypothetical protein